VLSLYNIRHVRSIVVMIADVINHNVVVSEVVELSINWLNPVAVLAWESTTITSNSWVGSGIKKGLLYLPIYK
jgi:hypothetical protein